MGQNFELNSEGQEMFPATKSKRLMSEIPEIRSRQFTCISHVFSRAAAAETS